MKNLKYLSYILRHKWFVFVECARHGLFWRGLVHDVSKFLPAEWRPYANWFYGVHGVTYEYTGFYWAQINHAAARLDFQRAWLFHQHRNPHHWQYWILHKDSGLSVALKMPRKYVVEMVCDWKGAGRAQGKTAAHECRDWYLANRDVMHLHQDTRLEVETMLGV